MNALTDPVASPLAVAVCLLVSLLASSLVLVATHEWRLPPEVVGAVVLLLGSAVAFHFLTGSFDLRRISVPGFWFLTYVPLIFVPSLFVYCEVDGPGKQRFLLGVTSLLVTVPVGIATVRACWRVSRGVERRFHGLRVVSGQEGDHLLGISWGLLVALTGLTALYLSEVPDVPLARLLSDPGVGSEALVLLREDSFKRLESPFLYAYALARTVGFPVLIVLSFGQTLVTRRPAWLAVFVVAFVVGVLFSAATLAKAPVAFLFLALAIYWHLHSRGRPGLWAVVVALVAGVAFPAAVVFALAGDDGDLGLVASGLFQRVFRGPAVVVYWYFELFPGDEGFLAGRSIGKWSWLVGARPFDLPNHVALVGLRARIPTASANGAFFADLYANFGIPGVLAGGVVVGGLLQGIQSWLARREKTVVTVTVQTLALLDVILLHMTSLAVVLASNGLLLVLAMPSILRVVSAVMRGASAGALERDRVRR